MKNKIKFTLKRSYILIFLIAALISLYLASSFSRIQTYKVLLRGFDLDNIHLNQYSYSIKNGEIFLDNNKINYLFNFSKSKEIYSLALFSKTLKEDPIFYSDEINIELLKKNINMISDTQNKLKKEVGFDEDIIGIDFLKSIIEVGVSKNKFVSEINIKNAKELISKYKNSLGEYVEGVNILKSNIEELYPYKNNQDFNLLNSKTSNQFIIDSLGLMIENADILSQEIDSRNSILEGALIDKKIKKNILTLSEEKVSTDKILPINSIEFEHDKTSINGSGPYGVETSCYSGEKKIEYFYVFSTKDDKSFARLATNTYYEKLNDGNFYYNYLMGKGQEWRFIRETNPYRCADRSFLAYLNSLSAYYDKYKNDPFMANIKKDLNDLGINIKSMLDEAESNENNFFNSKIPDQNSLNNLAKSYYNIYLAIVSTNVEMDIKDRLLTRYKEAINGLINYDKLYDEQLYMNNLLRRWELGMVNDKKSFLGYLYSVRTNYDIVYLNFSPIVWRLNKTINYDEVLTSDQKRIKSEGELLRIYKKETIDSWERVPDELLYEKIKNNKSNE